VSSEETVTTWDEMDARSNTRELRIDELAREAGTTVRNVRAYQERGLLPGPRRQGRVGMYSEAHLARLRLIGELLDRGYTTANIAELLEAWQRGQNVGELLGLEAALSAPWTPDETRTVSKEGLAELYGRDVSPEAALEVLRLGYIEPEGDHFRVLRPVLFDAGAALVAAGIPLVTALELGENLRSQIEEVAGSFVDFIATHIFDTLGDPPPAEDVPRLADIVQRLRPLGTMAVQEEFGRAMEAKVQATLGDRVARMLDNLARRKDAS
jgi:DNA-binding transcriptional MerR regulator